METPEFIDSIIVGQNTWKRTIKILMLSMSEGENLNILITGPSGYGKTYLSTIMLNWGIRIKRGEKIEKFTCDGKSFLFPEASGCLVDEAHLLRSPEHLYGHLDKEARTFIFCTNEYGDLPEPLVNRCFQIQLNPYRTEDLAKISDIQFKKRDIIVPLFLTSEVGKRARGTPRVAKKISELMLKGHNREYDLKKVKAEELDKIFEIYRIHPDGFRDYDYTYLNSLKEAGGRAGISTLVALSRLQKEFVLREVEPFLINSGYIQITTRGRILL